MLLVSAKYAYEGLVPQGARITNVTGSRSIGPCARQTPARGRVALRPAQSFGQPLFRRSVAVKHLAGGQRTKAYALLGCREFNWKGFLVVLVGFKLKEYLRQVKSLKER